LRYAKTCYIKFWKPGGDADNWGRTTMGRELKLNPAMVYVLLSLAEGAAHGYGILQDIERRSEGALTLGPSSLYYTLGRFEDAGLVAETDEPDYGEPHEDQRRYYRITQAGRTRLVRELDGLARLVAEGRRLGLGSEGGR
jgi:DNA-binding PadR family transcriptional regulator